MTALRQRICSITAAFKHRAADKQLDVNIVPADRRRKQILIANMDSAIITSESLNDPAALAGLADAVTAITKRAIAGEIDFEGALFERVGMLAGKSSRLFDQLMAATTAKSGEIELVHTMRANVAKFYLVLGEFDIITGPVAALCGFYDHRANHVHVCYTQLLGTVEMPVLHRNAKAAYLEHYCKQNGIDPIDAATIGGGANDLATCYISKAIKSVISSQIKLRDSICLIQIKGAKTGPLFLISKHCICYFSLNEQPIF